MSNHYESRFAVGQMQTLQNMIHELNPLLQMEGEFTSLDLPGDWGMRSQSVIRKAKINGAIDVVGETWYTRSNGKKGKRKVYKWDEEAKEQLLEYRNKIDTLPCGHRAHVFNSEGEGLGCRYCDETKNFDKDMVRKILNNE